MASRILLLPLTRPRTISVGLGITSIFAAQSLLTLRQPPIRCDAVATAGDFVRGYSREAQNPIVTRDGKVNRNVIRQLSAGSITGRWPWRGILLGVVVRDDMNEDGMCLVARRIIS